MIWSSSFSKIVNVVCKGILKLILLFQILQLIAQRPITNIYENPKYLLIIKVHEGWKPMATCVVDVHFVGWTQPNPKGPAHMSKPNPKNSSKRQRTENRQPALVHPWPRYSWRPLQENQVFEDELEVVPSTFCHPLPDVNSAQKLWYQLKSNGWWNSIIFLKTISPMKGGLKPSYPNLNKLML